jgi:peptide/nickel transport system substrate-binding protein
VKRALLLAMVLAACQSPPAPAVNAGPTPTGTRGGTLVMADFEYPDTLDPLHATTENDLRVAGLLFEPLWTIAPDLRPVPRLLAAMPVPRLARDGTMSLDLKLRPGLRWSDGSPLTADDVIFAIDAIRSDAYPGRDRSGFDQITVQERKSATELSWRFARPYAAWQLLGPRAVPLPAHRLSARAPTAWAADPYFQRPDVVSGPFLITGGVPGQLIQLAANPQYPAGRERGPWLDAITYRVYLGKAALITGLQTGEADLGFHLLPADLPQLADVPHSRSVVTPTMRGEFLLPNHGAGPWAGDSALLQALAASVDRRALNSAAFNGSAHDAAGLYPSPLQQYDAALPPRLNSKFGRTVSFSLLATCDDQVRQLEQAELVRRWSLLGAVVSTECEPRATFSARLAKGDFQMALLSNAWQPDPGAWGPFATTFGCPDPVLDQDFAAGAATMAPAARRTAYRAAASEWLRQVCTIPLYQWPSIVQGSTSLRGFEPNPVLGLDSWNAADWWLAS